MEPVQVPSPFSSLRLSLLVSTFAKRKIFELPPPLFSDAGLRKYPSLSAPRITRSAVLILAHPSAFCRCRAPAALRGGYGFEETQRSGRKTKGANERRGSEEHTSEL